MKCNGADETRLSQLLDRGLGLRRFSRGRIDGDHALHHRGGIGAIAARERRLAKSQEGFPQFGSLADAF